MLSIYIYRYLLSISNDFFKDALNLSFVWGQFQVLSSTVGLGFVFVCAVTGRIKNFPIVYMCFLVPDQVRSYLCTQYVLSVCISVYAMCIIHNTGNHPIIKHKSPLSFNIKPL